MLARMARWTARKRTERALNDAIVRGRLHGPYQPDENTNTAAWERGTAHGRLWALNAAERENGREPKPEGHVPDDRTVRRAIEIFNQVKSEE